jgi:hypothetical protein
MVSKAEAMSRGRKGITGNGYASQCGKKVVSMRYLHFTDSTLEDGVFLV